MSLILADFDIVRRVGDGSYSEVMQVQSSDPPWQPVSGADISPKNYQQREAQQPNLALQVRHKGTGADYALKMVDKHLIVRHRMVAHIKQERNILDECDYPGIAKLYFTFQATRAPHPLPSSCCSLASMLSSCLPAAPVAACQECNYDLLHA